MEMLVLSGLKAQSEINRLLDEIYGESDQASLDRAAQCSRAAETNRRQEGVELCTPSQRTAHIPLTIEA